MRELLPPIPEGSNWTHAQWEAINREGENILVTAGAGSGKTRVLVERIIKGLLDKKNPVEIDRLLVVTFTNAAAAEMRQRIAKALEGAIRKNPASAFLRRQMLLLNRASITTLHSFCREILRKYYYLRDLDPSSRILDETEGELLRQDLVEEVLEEFYEKEEEGSPFYRLVEAFSTHRGDDGMQALVRRLYSFSRSHPRSEAWLQAKADAFSLPEGGLKSAPWLDVVQIDCALELMGCCQLLERALLVANSPGGPLPYAVNLTRELAMLRQGVAAAENSWQSLATTVGNMRFHSLKACRGSAYDPHQAAAVRNMRDIVKKTVASMREEYFQRSLEEQEQEIRHLAPVMQVLVQLVSAFSSKYRLAKEERNVLDFSDLEHHALSILSVPAGGEDTLPLKPSEASLYYRQRFREVLVDEYQDTNEVQEALLTLLSKAGEEGGNLFMVGDVKQSIYRFRLAEPGLFLHKYASYQQNSENGLCIELSKNFRSRREVLSAVNYLFRQLMDKAVGEVDYVQETALVYGASYPALPPGDSPVEVLLISREIAGEEGAEDSCGGEGQRDAGNKGSSPGQGPEGEEEPGDESGEGSLPEVEMERAALEGRLIARKIKELISPPGPDAKATLIFDKGRGQWRPPAYRDMVILLRSTENWAPPLLEELQAAGIPAYAELGSGYFQAVEVEVMLSLLKIIDNPYQEIPLAAVLRSPLAGFCGEELALIRTAAPREAYYNALKAFCQSFETEDPKVASLVERVRRFLNRLKEWQRLSREGALAELIWQIYGETGYYDLVGGMPAGRQRQANLRALYDRARQYENTSFRGLLRFLRFVEKLQERGGDLGAARTLGEQEDVVRVMTIHKSKGLEFPVVFLGGVAKQFNEMDLRQDFLLHKDMGFGPRFLDSKLQVSYPTLPFLAVRKKLKLELLAEEMRILYVALTRAEEKLFLVASLKDLEKEAQRWALSLRQDGSPRLPARSRGAARCVLDWLGPALLRHPDAAVLREKAGVPGLEALPDADQSHWSIHVYSAVDVAAFEEDKPGAAMGDEESPLEVMATLAEVESFKPVPLGNGGDRALEVNRRLSWSYPFLRSATHLAKVSVSELKQRRQQDQEDSWRGEGPLVVRPRFLEKEKLTATERGTAYHTVLQYLDLQSPLHEAGLLGQMEQMVASEKITREEKDAVNAADLAALFAGPLGERLLKAAEVRRELAFSLALPAAEVYEDWDGEENGGQAEKVLLQGVIDCLFRDEQGLVLLDYKTDRTGGLSEAELKKRYREQVEIYSRAVQDIWQEEVKERYLYFFDGGLTVPL